jgi:ribosome biogenesis GTPase
LATLGWDDAFAQAAREAARDLERPTEAGRVARLDRGMATVLLADAAVRAALVPGDETVTVATGDWVLVEDAHGDEPIIVARLPRRSAFVRGDPFDGVALDAQVVAANIDTVFVVQSLTNGPNLRRLERELVLAWQSGATPVIVLTKRDLVEGNAPVHDALETVAAIAPNVPIVVTSSVTGEGIDTLQSYAANGRTVALIGASGVGKSTLVNQLVGEDVQATSGVRERDQRGRHTTTARELVVLPAGGVLVDTPGLRAVLLWDADEGLERAFADVEALANECRFRDCRHDREPECAVRRAAETGDLDPQRLASYQRLTAERDRQAATVEEQARRDRPRRRRR